MDFSKKNFIRAALILAVGAGISFLIVVSKPQPQPDAHPEPPPHVAEIIAVIPKSHAITVASQGTVTPKTEVDITARVGGEVVAVGEHFAAGGFFTAGETLLTLDPQDYEIALVRAQAALAEARNNLAQERGQARQAEREWRDLGNEAANALFLRKPQVAAAEARVEAAQADVKQARLDLERTRISLPFDGRVVSVEANLGQFINAGASLGRVYAADVMEVRLPLTAADLGLLNMRAGGDKLHELHPLAVDLYFNTGINVMHWRGDVVRMEASVDRASRLFYLVAEIDNRVGEFDEHGKPVDRSPILPGTFVTAAITSNPHDGVVILPRSALYESDKVLVLDEESRLRLRRVTVLQLDEHILVVKGLEDGQSVLAKPPDFMDLGAVYTTIPASPPGEDA